MTVVVPMSCTPSPGLPGPQAAKRSPSSKISGVLTRILVYRLPVPRLIGHHLAVALVPPFPPLPVARVSIIPGMAVIP